MIEGPLSKLKILVVEDQSDARAALVCILESIGVAEIFEADDGRQALEFIGNETSPVDLVLSDWNMPVMFGVEFFRTMRSRGDTTPFFLITGRGDHESVLEARSIGIDGYIRKPFSPGQVEARLRILAQRMKAA